jgi:outer membrane protein assembly factor BamA
LPTYGLGTNSPPDSTDYDGGWIWQGADTKDTEGGYPMLYDNIRLHEIAYREIIPSLYAGVGYHLDYYWNIEDTKLNLDTLPVQITPHFVYSRLHEFNADNYILSGFSLNFMYDSRDNLINSYKGYYFNMSYRINQTWLGSDQNATSLWLEFRTYIGLSKKMPRHLVAFWVFGDLQVTGNRPYLTLMALGEDQKARSGRGYVGGRFRGQDYFYAEAEYRFPISQCSELIGGVVFVNMNTASNRDAHVALFQYVMPAAGFGLRLKFNKNTRLNINLDFSIGIKSRGFYFSGTETF